MCESVLCRYSNYQFLGPEFRTHYMYIRSCKNEALVKSAILLSIYLYYIIFICRMKFCVRVRLQIISFGTRVSHSPHGHC